MSQMLKMYIDDVLSEVAGRHLDEFMRQYVRKIAVGMVLFVPFGLNVYNPIYNPNPKFPNRLQNLLSRINIQLIKCMPSMHAETLKKLVNHRIIHTPSSIRQKEFPKDDALLPTGNPKHRGNVDGEGVQKRRLRRHKEVGSW